MAISFWREAALDSNRLETCAQAPGTTAPPAPKRIHRHALDPRWESLFERKRPHATSRETGHAVFCSPSITGRRSASAWASFAPGFRRPIRPAERTPSRVAPRSTRSGDRRRRGANEGPWRHADRRRTIPLIRMRGQARRDRRKNGLARSCNQHVGRVASGAAAAGVRVRPISSGTPITSKVKAVP